VNALRVLNVYRYNGMWVFDDEDVGLSREPFVSGVPEIFDKLLLSKGISGYSFNLVFSDQKFPNCDAHAVWTKAEDGGNWYTTEIRCASFTGWLCPALFRYYEQAPADLYFSVQKAA
jgi:hypothetical protein